MNLDQFKPSWNQFKIMNRFDQLSADEIMRIVETGIKEKEQLLWQKVMRYATLYSLLIIFCQG